MPKTIAISFLTISMVLAAISMAIPMASAAGSITLTPSSGISGSSVTVTGTGFGATKAVGIGLGQEVVVTGEAHTLNSPAGTGPFTVIANHYPIKPGSFSFHCVVSSDTNVVESDYTDNGDGTLSTSSTYSVSPFVNYVTGAFGRSSTSDWSSYTVVFTASYTYYQYTVTPAGGVTTTASGAFTTNIIVPNVNTGTYAVTAIDASGNIASSNLSVAQTIPEGLNIGVMVLLSSVAVLVGSPYFRKRLKI
jgi:hypothetical protein